VCGRTEAGFDMDLSDAEMRECENRHTICESHMNRELSITALAEAIMRRFSAKEYTKDQHDKYLKDKESMLLSDWAEMIVEQENDIVYDIQFREMPQELCPACAFSSISNSDLIDYLLKKVGLTRKVATSICQKEFKSYGEFRAYVDAN